ncbi:ICOS ligand-like isoform X2 [Lissotriton helveticus]
MGVPKTRSWLLLLMLWLTDAAINGINGTVCSANCQKQLVGVLGTSVNLSCVYPEKKTFPLDTLMIYWQNNEKAVVAHTFIGGQDDFKYQNQSYKNRTHLFKDRLKEGDFSLQISNLTLNDTMAYMCVVMQTHPATECIHKSCASLKVAARFSSPVLTESGDFLNCSSSNGHPKPKLYWINGENASSLNPSLSTTVVEYDPDTQLYSVRSQLRINTTTLRNISCRVENTVLMENLTSYFVRMVDPTGSYVINEKQTSRANQATAGVLSSTVILLVVVAVIVCLCKRNRCGAYRGVAQVDLELQQQMSEDQRTSQNVPAAPEANDGRPSTVR